jgi:magnesium transporter
MADELIRQLLVHHPQSAAQTLERYPADEAASMFAGLAGHEAANLAGHMPPLFAARIVERLPARQRSDIFNRLPSGQAAQIAARMPREVVEALMHTLSLLQSTSIRNAMRFPDGTAGSIMRTDVLTLSLPLTAGEARNLARAAPQALQAVLFIVDSQRHPNAVVDISDLCLAEDATPLSALTRPCPRPVAARMRLNLVLRESAWSTIACVPVIDSDGSMLGVVMQSELLRLTLGRIGIAGSGSATLTDAAMAVGELVWSVGAAAIEQTGGNRR